MENPMHQTLAKSNPELMLHLDAAAETRGAFFVLHTFMHQLMAVAPMLVVTSTTSDLQELDLDENLITGYIADNVPGGNGAAETLFEKFEEFVKVAEDWGSACHSCEEQKRSAWGCALCLYQAGGKCHNSSRGLMAVCGAPMLRLRALDQPKTSISIVDAETDVVSPRVYLGHLATVSQAPRHMSPFDASGYLEEQDDVVVDKATNSSSGCPSISSGRVETRKAPSARPPPTVKMAKPALIRGATPAPPVPQITAVPVQKIFGVPVQVPEPLQLAGVVVASTPPVIPSTPETQNVASKLNGAQKANDERDCTRLQNVPVGFLRPHIPVYYEPEVSQVEFSVWRD